MSIVKIFFFFFGWRKEDYLRFLHCESRLRSLSSARSKRFPKTKASRSQAVSRRGASHDLAAARAISAAACVAPEPPPLLAWASNIFATCYEDNQQFPPSHNQNQ